MSGQTPRDEAEAEPLSPARTHLNWRDTRDADRYREWCLDRFGGYIELGEYEFHPAAVLTLKEGATEKTREECRSQLEAEDNETICEQYPAPIAVPYHQFLNGPRDPMRRLTRMRDTWEGLINLLSALALAEAARIGVGSGSVMVVERGSRHPVRARDLRSDRLSGRLGLLEGLLESWRESGVRAAVADLIAPGVVAELRRLNAVRNGFSHLGTLSDAQARARVEETAPLLQDSLVDVLDLANVQLVRLSRVVPGWPPTAEVESLNGHAWSRRVTDLALDADSETLVLRAGRIDNYDRVLAKIGTRVLDLAPYFYACDDSSGHHTRVCFFKKRNEGQCHFEVVGEAVEVSSDATLHDPEFFRCQAAVLGDGIGHDDE
jgi:hypothetical protein